MDCDKESIGIINIDYTIIPLCWVTLAPPP